jgi:NTP pyrophosphatase (non-canonical NTP hydrolase)
MRRKLYAELKRNKEEQTTMLTIEDLCEANLERCRKGFGHSLASWSLLEWAGATAGEIGEACNVAKKIIRVRDGIRGNKPEDNLSALRAKFGQELSDGIIYAVLAMLAAGLDPEDEIRKAFNNKSIEIGAEARI